MIESDLQHRITKDWIERFKVSIAALKAGAERSPSLMVSIQIGALESQLVSLEAESEEWEGRAKNELHLRS